MGRKLYMVWGSPPVNAVLMTAAALNVPLDNHIVDLSTKANFEQWFLKINPAHTVPVLDDDDFIIWDSHAIMVYLVETYGKGNDLEFRNTKEKAKILQILNLDCGTIFRRISDALKPLIYEGQKEVNPKQLEYAKESYTILERILQNSKYLALDRVTIADVSVFSTVLAMDIVIPISEQEFPKLKSWFTHMNSLDIRKGAEKGINANQEGVKKLLGIKK